MYDILTKLKADRAFQEKMLQCYEAELANLPKGVLCHKEKNGRKYYYKQVFENGRRTQIYMPSAQSEEIDALKLRRFFQESIKIYKNNIRAADRMIKSYRSYDPNMIQENLPKAYQPLPNKCFFDMGKIHKSQWGMEDYKQNGRYQEKKIHITPSGLHVQSRGEAIIATDLEFHGIPFRYDHPLELGAYTLHPDFTLIDPVRNIPIYWEHFGMLNDADYFNAALWKLQVYQEHGISLYDRLIITADAPDGSFNAQIVDNIIKLFFLRV